MRLVFSVREGSNSSTNENDDEKIETDNDDAPLIIDSNRTFDRQYSTSFWKRIISCGNKNSPSGKLDSNEIKNPKIANMLPGYENAQFPFVLISDSGIMMREDALYDMYTCMDETVGLVHQLPFTSDRNGFVGSLEKVLQIFSFCFFHFIFLVSSDLDLFRYATNKNVHGH